MNGQTPSRDLRCVAARRFAACTSALILSMASSCGYRASVGDIEGAALASIGELSIDSTDLEREFEHRGITLRTATQARATLAELVRFQALVAMARKEGYQKREAVKRAMDNVLVQRYLDETLRVALKEIEISQEEVVRYYEAHQDQFTLPESRRGALIWLDLPLNATPEDRQELRARAQAIRDEVVQASRERFGFGPRTAQWSDHAATRFRNGDMGWLTRDEPAFMDPSAVEALFHLSRPGEVSQVVEAESGVFLVSLIAQRDAGVQPLDRVRGRIRSDLQSARRKKAEREFYARIFEQCDVRTCALSEEELAERLQLDQEKPSMSAAN